MKYMLEFNIFSDERNNEIFDKVERYLQILTKDDKFNLR